MKKLFLLLSFVFGSLLVTQLPVKADANFSIKKNENQYTTGIFPKPKTVVNIINESPTSESLPFVFCDIIFPFTLIDL